MNRTKLTSMAFFFTIFVGFAVVAGYFETQLDRSAVDWPQAIAKVLSHEDCANVYECGVKYTYTVKGENFVGSRVLFSGYHMPKGWSHVEKKRWVVKEFPINKLVPVFYNIENPEQSALRVGMTIESFKGSIRFLGPILIFLFAALAWCVFAKKT